jgi:two-component system sensor histidine kinase BaeS
MRSLGWKLGGALVLVALIAIGLMAFLTNLNTTSQFRSYMQSGNMMHFQNVASELGQYYSTNGSWKGVDVRLKDSIRMSGDRLVLADVNGQIVGDTANQWQGLTAESLTLSGGISVSSSGRNYGTLYTFTSSAKGYMGGRGMMGNGAAAPAITAESALLKKLNSYLWIAGSIAFLAAIILGLIITRQITRPLRSLTSGADQIARGNLNYRVSVKSNDEVGALGRSFNSMAVNLEKSEQSRQRLVSDVTHELRTPLTIIEGTVDGMIDGVFPADPEHLNTIKEQSQTLTQLVADLRDLSLAESGQLKLHKTPTDMKDLIRRKIEQFESLAAEKPVKLELLSTTVIPEIAIDTLRIDQVVTNLFTNAIRHTPANGKVTISLSSNNPTELNKAGWIEINVSDTGEGIPSEHLPHIFDRFYRVENSRSRREGGAGLGLAIVKQMVEAHGGSVQVESEPGKGSIFTVRLPVITVEE